MTLSPAQKAARWLLVALGDRPPQERLASGLTRASEGRFERSEIAMGLRMLQRRGHAEKDPTSEWRRLHLGSRPWRLTPAGELEREAWEMSLALKRDRSSSGEQPPPPLHPA